MSGSLINSAMSGLSAAQVALNTVSNNISSYNVAGYSRQTTVLTQTQSTLGAGGWSGNGVTVSAIQREYDAFISGQLNAAQTQSSGLTSRYQQLAQVDDLFADSTSNLTTAMRGFFSALTTLTSNANDPAARESLLGQAYGLVNQFRVTDQYLRNMDKQVNSAVSSSVAQINSYTQQIAALNDKIGQMTAVGSGAQPNDLLDRRDQLLSELNKIVGVQVTVQDGNSWNVSMANGITLVQGGRASALAAVPSAADPGRTVVATVDSVAGTLEIPEQQIASGSLGGVLTFRSQDLDSARNQMGQLALAFTSAINQQHASGFDANGDAGSALFTSGAPAAQGNKHNDGSASLSISVTDSRQVQASSYRVAYGQQGWQVTRQPAGTVVDAQVSNNSPLTIEFEGLSLSLSVSGSAAPGDSFTVNPVRDVIAGMSVAINDGAQLALAGESDAGESDNRNAQALLDLQNASLVGGNKTFNDSYAGMVADIGNKTSTLKTTSATQASVVTQLTEQQQSISGVNLDEEYGNLQRYQQYYLANAQVLRTASTLFDALLSIRS
ncbi:flagellar hook-associated protein FlgK [Entomohabitans teleogrylli]|uniref:flagellar hook-associated protein FlgK n=1 Tax=Entomohabitans teleogrylli TaxID=1384589 RepID=UPI00073D5EF3|nr:flagellar hook-associated protein FlgK [Entomohabitans teleogrylli]